MAGIWDFIMEGLAKAHDGSVQMIDTSIVRVHQHPGCAGGKHYKPEEIVAKLRQVDVMVSQGRSVADAGVTEATYYRWRREFGGLKTDQVKRMKELEAENAGCVAPFPI
jgi:putative transposase